MYVYGEKELRGCGLACSFDNGTRSAAHNGTTAAQPRLSPSWMRRPSLYLLSELVALISVLHAHSKVL